MNKNLYSPDNTFNQSDNSWKNLLIKIDLDSTSRFLENEKIKYCSWEVIRSIYINDNSIYIVSWNSWFHMRPLLVLIWLVDNIRINDWINLTIKIWNTEYNYPFSLINIFLEQIKNWKEIIVFSKEWNLTQELLSQLENDIIMIDDIWESVPNAIWKILW